MATKRKRSGYELMAWCAAEGRWRKRRRGKSYAVSPRQLGFDDGDRRASRAAANEWWLAKSKALSDEEQQSAQDAKARAARDVQTTILRNRDGATVRSNYLAYLGWNAVCQFVERRIRDGEQIPAELLAILNDGAHGVATETADSPVVAAAKQRLDELDAAELFSAFAVAGISQPQSWHSPQPQEQSARTLRAHIDEYLAVRRQGIDTGKIKANTHAQTVRCMDHFATFLGEDSPISCINEASILAYYQHVTQSGGKRGPWGPWQQRHAMAAMKQFVRRLYRLRIIDELPRNIATPDNELTIPLPAVRIETFTTEEIASLLEHSTRRYQLLWLLCLNCGFTQQDAADLRHEEVDWREGRIVRKRGKTKQHRSVPVVDYLLWPRTLELLREFRSDDPQRVLLNAAGQPLRQDSYGRILNKRDAAKEAWKRLTRPVTYKNKKGCKDRTIPAKVIVRDGLTIKHFRKTGASLLANEFGDEMAERYLGHAPRTVASKHYLKRDQSRFDSAITWLGEALGVCKK